MAQAPKYKDVSLTFRANPVTGDVVKLYDTAAVQASVVNLVLTMNYEIPFHPEVGCAVQRSLFDEIGPMTAINIRRSILDVLQNFEPRVQVVLVQVTADPDNNGYDALIVYQIVGQPMTASVTMFLKKTR
jgi:phage baseplate assembly protein W